jgi:hypothetical protein
MALLFTNELALREQLQRIPAALHDRFTNAIEELAANLGIRPIASTSNSVEVDISGASPANFFRFLEDAHIAAVSISPQDVVALLGRNLDSLLLKRAIERGEVKFEKLLPEEITPSLREAAWNLVGTTTEATQLDTELAQFDLKAAGLMTDADFLEPAEPERFHGFHSSPNDSSAIPDEFREEPAPQYDPFL